MLVGRDTELAAIDQVLDRARNGSSAVLTLKGEAGIGKSALLAAAAERAQGMRILRATGVESELEMPFAGLHQLLWPVMPHIESLVAPQASALRGALGLGGEPGTLFMVGAALLSLVAEVAEREPLVFLIDDAHWLDEPSIVALTFAARRLESESVGGLLTVREGESRSRLIRHLPAIQVKGLDPQAANDLLDSLEVQIAPEVRRHLVFETQGNPLALKELVAGLTSAQMAGKSALPAWLPIPDRLARTYSDRARALPVSTQRLLLLAASDWTADLSTIEAASAKLGAIGGDPSPAERAHLIRIEENKIVFCHPLVRSAIYQGASTAERLAAHRALAGVPAEGGGPEWRVWHLAMATRGKDEEIASALEATADQIQRRQGTAAAASALERSADLSERESIRARRLAKAAISNLEGGWLDRAQALLMSAESAPGNPRTEAEIRLGRAWASMHTTTFTNADVEALLRVAKLIKKLDPEYAADLLSLSSFMACFDHDWSTATEAARQVLGLSIPEDSLQKRRGRDIVGAFDAGGILECDYLGLPYKTLTKQLTPQSFLPPTVVELAGEEVKAYDLVQRAAKELRTRGAIWVLIPITTSLAHYEYLLGRWSNSETHASEALAIAQQTGQDFLAAVSLGFLARLAAVRGDRDRCEQLAQQMHVSESTCPFIEGLHTWALALLDLGSGHFRQTRDRLVAIHSIEDWPGHDHIALRTSGDLAEAAIGCGLVDEAELVLAGLEGWAGARPPAWAQVILHRCRGLLAEDSNTAEADFRAALSVPADHRRPWEHARAELLYGRWLRRHRRRSEARTYLGAALHVFERLGAEPWSQQTRNELRAAGETIRQPETSALKQLTPQELQIARLAAQGMTNREIGAQLFLSPRTVGTHLYRLFPKLGIASRSDLRTLDLEETKPLAATG
jgi:DNA-binding CsgD family transcriptional regulator